MRYCHAVKWFPICLVLFLAGCSLQHVRPQALTPGQADLAQLSDDLGILLVRLDGNRHVLTDLRVRHVESGKRYLHPFVDDPKNGSSVLAFEQMGGENGALEHVLFLDLPAGKYQITELEISDKAHHQSYRIKEVDSLYFEFGLKSPAYIGELFVSLGKVSRTGLLSQVEEVFFMPSVRAETNLERVTKPYPALDAVKIHSGRIWDQ